MNPSINQSKNSKYVKQFLEELFSDNSNSSDIGEVKPNDTQINIQTIEIESEIIPKSPIKAIEIMEIETTKQKSSLYIEDNQNSKINYFLPETRAQLWKKIHYHAWHNRLVDPNLFYYYFHKFDESLDSMPFTIEEEESLMTNIVICYNKNKVVQKERIFDSDDENIVQGNWGLFSLKMLGRNGIMCYNHYLKLKMKHNQYKSNESFKHYLIKKVNPADYSDVDNDGFLEFFMNLGPGYLEKSENLDLFKKVKGSLHVCSIL